MPNSATPTVRAIGSVVASSRIAASANITAIATPNPP